MAWKHLSTPFRCHFNTTYYQQPLWHSTEKSLSLTIALGMHNCLLFAAIIQLFLLITKGQDSDDDGIAFDCNYNEEYLTASTKSPWASHCAVIAGLIKIGSLSNLTEVQLEKLFQNITTVKGTIVVEGTNLRRLSFLRNVVKIITYHSAYVLEIIGNAFLTQLNLDKFNSSDGIVRIQRNPLLNVSSLCNRLDAILDGNWQVSRNKVNCGGYLLDYQLTFTSILNVPSNLTVIQGDVILKDTGIPLERLAVLSSVKKIAGCLIVQRTNLETLSFLGNLEEINCRSRNNPAISLYINNYLNSLGLSKLTKINTIVPVEAMGNRILEITYDEIEVLVSTDVPTIQFNGIFPTDALPWDICIFNSLKEDLIMLSVNCTSLVGLFYYENRSFSMLEVEILKRMRNIYGNVELVNVNITDLSMFSALERIISFNETPPAIQLSSMDTLKSIEMPNLKFVYAPCTTKFAIQNCPNISFTLSECRAMYAISQNTLTIDNKSCRELFEDSIE